MAIVRMTKIMIACHRSQASDLLDALQSHGICQILNAEQAMVCKDSPELVVKGERPRDVEELIGRLEKAISFLQGYSQASRGLGAMLAPRPVVDARSYGQVVGDGDLLKEVDHCEQAQASIERGKNTIESIQTTLDMLRPWEALETPVEQLGQLRSAVCWAGLVPSQHLDGLRQEMSELGAGMEEIGSAGSKHACLVVSLKETAEQVQRMLRSAEFELVNFESMSGTVAELIGRHREKLEQARRSLEEHIGKARAFALKVLNLQILYDHYRNLLERERTKETSPATRYTVLFEGWVKKKNYARLQEIVSEFSAASVGEISPGEGEEIPVEIENHSYIRPFEFITRLYGMPQPSNVDPTIFLAPFFALFFGICLGDAGYGLTMVIATALVVKKMQGDKKLLWMLGACSVFAILVGVLTGSWFGDAVTTFTPALDPLRMKLMWFDPLKQPLMMFGLAIGLGYLHLMTGLLIAFVHNIKQRDYAAAVFEQLTWLVMLNSILVFGLSKAGVVPPGIGKFCSRLAIVPTLPIVLFSSRQGGWGARIGMGAYNLFSSVFWLGDCLSYLRLMALGMVSSGLGMAINVIAKLLLKVPYGLGIVLMLVVFLGGHAFNLILSVLGAFVHTMRLQFVEFFPKFLAGGGREFQPLCKEYKHIFIA